MAMSERLIAQRLFRRFCANGPESVCAVAAREIYAARVQALEAIGLCTSDAQAAVDAEIAQETRA